jgi:hypothetical protein
MQCRWFRSDRVMFTLLVAAAALYGFHVSVAARHPRDTLTIFDPDPNHIWNRTYSCLFVRQSIEGEEYGNDALDPLLWSSTHHLLDGDSHRRALNCLDEFLSSHADRSVQDPVKRAILQHDLWAVFDWAAAGDGLTEQRRELQRRLCEAIHRLALTSKQIEALPDTYNAAAVSRHFPLAYDTSKPQGTFLPPELFRPDGPWVCLTAHSEEPTAIVHFSGRSRFLVFMRLPGERDVTLRYLESLRSSSQPPLVMNGPVEVLNLALPQFPVGTEVALVRQLIVINNEGTLVPTRVTESVQLRVYHAVTPGTRYLNYIDGPSGHDQDFFEIRMSRPALFGHRVGGLVAVGPTETEFATFSTHGMDPFESASGLDHESVVLERCRFCHSDSGIHSVQSRLEWIKPRPVTFGQMDHAAINDAITWESYATITRKEQEADFKLLQNLWQLKRR